jgi:hypothetical protein
MYGKWVITGIMVTVLSGCTAGFRPSLEDYKGSDAARIRAASDGNTALQFYEKQPSGCYKKVLERRITAGLAILGIPVTGNKKIGMPESSDNKGSFINEFTVKPRSARDGHSLLDTSGLLPKYRSLSLRKIHSAAKS